MNYDLHNQITITEIKEYEDYFDFDTEVENNLLIDWEPMVMNASIHRTKKLTYRNKEILRFSSTFLSILVNLSFIALLIAELLLIILMPSMSKDILNLAVLSIGGIMFLDADHIPIVFNKIENKFKKGTPWLKGILYDYKDPVSIDIGEIKYVQLLKKQLLSGIHAHSGYEINLVLSNGKRANVICHSKLKNIKNNAHQLSTFLNVPLIDNL